MSKDDCCNECDGNCRQQATEHLKADDRKRKTTRLGFPSKDRTELSRLIKAALARGPMTPEEQFEQAVSFVYGQMMDCAPNVTKEQVRETLRKHYCML